MKSIITRNLISDIAAKCSASRALGAVAALCLFASVAGAEPINGNEWHTWRGPDDNGSSRATGLVDSWTEGDANVLWKSTEAGGRATPIIMNGRVYAQRLTGEGPTWQEEVVCLDAHTGEVIWRDAFDIFHTDIPSDRVGWASVAGDPETGYVYAHGVQGIYTCYDGDGNIVWRHSMTEEFGRISGYGGRTHTPFIDRDLVILSFLNSGLGKQGPGRHRYVAMNKLTGEVVYWATPGGPPLDTTFSVPTVAVVNGVRQLIAGNADGWLYGMKIATGEKVWGFKLTRRGINASIVVEGNYAYVLHGEDNIDNTTMGRAVCVDITGEGDVTATHEVWRRDGLRAAYASPAIGDGRFYAVDNSANLFCLDAKTGEEYWKLNVGNVGWGSPTWADGKIYIAEADGVFRIVDVSGDAPELLSKIEFQDDERQGVDIRGCASVAYGRIYVQTRTALYCVGSADKGQEIAIDPLPEDGAADSVATFLRVEPGEAHLHAGESIQLAARLFDSSGRPIGDASDVQWTLKGLKGSIEGGNFTATADANGQFGMIEAKAGDLAASARIRVKTTLPIIENFDSRAAGKPGPNHWIGGSRVKFKVIDEDGNNVYKKDADNIRFRRALVYMGPPEMTNYTVQVDARGSEKRRSLPDMGVINSRYVCDLRGNDQQFRIYAWVPMPRVIATVPFEIEPEVWYRIKCRVDYEGTGAVIRAKAWNRDEPEPEAWTLELNDPQPNPGGSPGLACFSMAEVYYDNISVTSNETTTAMN